MHRPVLREAYCLAIFTLAATLAACGGGGGGSGSTGGGGGIVPPNPTPTVSPTPTPAPTPTPITTSSFVGTVNTCDSTYIGNPQATPSPAPQSVPSCSPNAALVGARVTVGSVPAGCHGQACQHPTSPLPSGTTNASGGFSIANVPNGTYMIEISNGSGYAVLHTTITVPQASSPTYRLTQLSTVEQTWAADINAQRVSNAGYAVQVDENVEEGARGCALYQLGGLTWNQPYSASCAAPWDPSGRRAQYAAQYTANGGMYTFTSGAVGGNNSCCNPGTGADSDFFAPANIGYSNSSSTVWMGVATVADPNTPTGFNAGTSEWVFSQSQQ